MKTVFSGDEVPHRFAHDKKAVARNANRTIFCEEGVIYSYRTSAPLAAWRGDMILVNSDKYSVTTSKHQSWLRHAISHIPQVTVPALRDLLGCRSESGLAAYIAARHAEIQELKAKKFRADWKIRQNEADIAHLESVCEFVWRDMAGKRSHWLRAIDAKMASDKAEKIRRYTAARNQLDSGMETARRMLSDCRDAMVEDIAQGRNHTRQAWWRLETTQRDIRRLDVMGAARGLGFAGNATFATAAKLMGKKWTADCIKLAEEIHAFADSLQPEIDAMRAEFLEAERIANAEVAAAWIAGGRDAPSGPTLCRVVGNEVQTSRGARVPLKDALMVFELAKTRRPFKTDKACGIYRGIAIDAEGNITIGCHHILFSDAADCFKRYQESIE